MVVKIFFCYAHEDEELLKKLKSHLRPLQRQGLIDIWHDRDISAGSEWEKEINIHLNAAQIILLLISPDFMNSEYCYGKEMQRAMERHERGEACVIPIILDHVYWQIAPLSKLQALPTDAKPIMSSSWHNLNEAFFNVVEGLRKVIFFGETLPTYNAEENSVRSNRDKYDKFSEFARQSLNLAQQEGLRLHQNQIGTEHILLAILQVEESNAVKILSSLHVDLNKIRSSVGSMSRVV